MEELQTRLFEYIEKKNGTEPSETRRRCFRAMRSRLEPMKKVARMLRAHEPLILNWFRAKGEISNGAVEGLNNKIRVVTRRSYGFRTFEAMEIALYHNLGRLPEPESPHRFC
jgi:transposase